MARTVPTRRGRGNPFREPRSSPTAARCNAPSPVRYRGGDSLVQHRGRVRPSAPLRDPAGAPPRRGPRAHRGGALLRPRLRAADRQDHQPPLAPRPLQPRGRGCAAWIETDRGSSPPLAIAFRTIPGLPRALDRPWSPPRCRSPTPRGDRGVAARPVERAPPLRPRRVRVGAAAAGAVLRRGRLPGGGDDGVVPRPSSARVASRATTPSPRGASRSSASVRCATTSSRWTSVATSRGSAPRRPSTSPRRTPGSRPFTAAEVAELAAQHTADTGQRFDDEAVARVFTLSAGHPVAGQRALRPVHPPRRHRPRHRRHRGARRVGERDDHPGAPAATSTRCCYRSGGPRAPRDRSDDRRGPPSPAVAGSRRRHRRIAYVAGPPGLCRVIDGRCEAANPIYPGERPLTPLTSAPRGCLEDDGAAYGARRGEAAGGVGRVLAGRTGTSPREG